MAISEDAGALPRAVFHHRGFTLLWAARLSSVIGVQMLSLGVSWVVYNLTGSVLDLGLIGLVQFVPILGLALFTGHVADRYDRRRVTRACYAVELVCAAALLAMTVTGSTAALPILAIVLVFGAARAFENPAASALLPNVVPRPLFPAAVAWVTSAVQTATILGPAMAGFLFAVGAPAVFAVAAALLAAAAVLVSGVPATRSVDDNRSMTWATLVAGVAFIRGKPEMLGAVSLDLFAVLLGGATALLPVYARDILRVGAWGLGLLRSAPAMGAVAMALALAHHPIGGRIGPLMFASVAAYGVATIVFGVSTSFILSIAALVMLGAMDAVSVVVRKTLIQLAPPDELRGRVGAMSAMSTGASNYLGQFESGVTAAWFGTVPAVVLGGAGALAVAALWAWRFPTLRRLDRIDAAD